MEPLHHIQANGVGVYQTFHSLLLLALLLACCAQVQVHVLVNIVFLTFYLDSIIWLKVTSIPSFASTEIRYFYEINITITTVESTKIDMQCNPDNPTFLYDTFVPFVGLESSTNNDYI